MADSGPSARSVANSVLNSTSPTYLPEDQELGGTLEQLIRVGDQKNPRGGFSYLDNIARILTDSKLKDSGDVLLEQLLGRPPAARNPFGAGEDIKPIPTEPIYDNSSTGASDLTRDQYRDYYQRYLQLGTPPDQSQSRGGYFGKPVQTRKRT